MGSFKVKQAAGGERGRVMRYHVVNDGVDSTLVPCVPGSVPCLIEEGAEVSWFAIGCLVVERTVYDLLRFFLLLLNLLYSDRRVV